MRSGGTPNLAFTPGTSSVSLLMVLTSVTCALTSCARSLSPVATMLCAPACAVIGVWLPRVADHIARFHSIQHQEVPAGCGDGLMQRLYLLHQIGRHGGAMRLVFGIPVVPECFTFCVEYAQAIIRRVIMAQLAQHVEHAVDRTGRITVAVAKVRHGMERAVQEGRAGYRQ